MITFLKSASFMLIILNPYVCFKMKGISTWIPKL